MSEFHNGNTPANELQIYTWLDASLKELTSLIRDVNPETRKKGTYFDFALVYPDNRPGAYRMREIGVTCSQQRGADDNKTLAQAKFQIGDFLAIRISFLNKEEKRGPDRRDRDRERDRDDRGHDRNRGRPY
jgi:histone deacetylase complex subunit SAP18